MQKSSLLYGEGFAHNEYTSRDIQDLLQRRVVAHEAEMVLESNCEVFKAIRGFYIELKEHQDFPLTQSCVEDISDFINHLNYVINDNVTQISRVRHLADIINGHKDLVSQHIHEKAEERDLNLEREATMMRIITVVTLVYLPGTFVSVSESSLYII